MTVKMSRWIPLSGLVLMLSACMQPGLAPAGFGSSAVEPQRAVSELPTTTPAQRSARVHVELGRAYLLSGRNGVALDEARTAVGSDPGYAPAHLLTGLIYAEQEQYALATPSFEQAYRLAPGDPEINNAYGWFLCSQGRESEGLPMLERAASNPYYTTPTRAWSNAGLCLLRKKDDAGAEARFLRAVQADPSNSRAVAQLAEINYRTQRDLAAKKWIDQLQQLVKESNPAILWLAIRIEKRLGNAATVNDLGIKLRREFPASPEYQAFAQGKFE